MKTDGLEIGLAKATATTQQFLNSCSAVKEWEPIEYDDSGEATLFAFTFDPTVEVQSVPVGVHFSVEED